MRLGDELAGVRLFFRGHVTKCCIIAGAEKIGDESELDEEHLFVSNGLA